jgi:hypothetical protein
MNAIQDHGLLGSIGRVLLDGLLARSRDDAPSAAAIREGQCPTLVRDTFADGRLLVDD